MVPSTVNLDSGPPEIDGRLCGTWRPWDTVTRYAHSGFVICVRCLIFVGFGPSRAPTNHQTTQNTKPMRDGHRVPGRVRLLTLDGQYRNTGPNRILVDMP